MLVLDNKDVALEMHDLRVFVFREYRLRGRLGVLPRNSAHALEQLLFFIHQCVRAFKHIVEAAVRFGVVFRKAAGDNDLIFADMLHRAVVQRQNQFLPNQIIAPAHNHDKFISAGAENRAVLEDVADHLTGLANVFVARFVAKRIVDDLQAVHITDDDGERVRRPALNGGVDFLLAEKEGMLALDAGQGIGKRDGLSLVALLLRFFLPPLH